MRDPAAAACVWGMLPWPLPNLSPSPSPTGSLSIVLDKLRAQKSDLEHPGRLVVEAALGSVARALDLLRRHPEQAGSWTHPRPRLGPPQGGEQGPGTDQQCSCRWTARTRAGRPCRWLPTWARWSCCVYCCRPGQTWTCPMTRATRLCTTQPWGEAWRLGGGWARSSASGHSTLPPPLHQEPARGGPFAPGCGVPAQCSERHPEHSTARGRAEGLPGGGEGPV